MAVQDRTCLFSLNLLTFENKNTRLMTVIVETVRLANSGRVIYGVPGRLIINCSRIRNKNKNKNKKKKKKKIKEILNEDRGGRRPVASISECD